MTLFTQEPRILPAARVAILISALVAAGSISLVLTGTLVPASPPEAFIFQSALLFVVLGSALLEHKFTKPADSVVNALMGMVSLLTVANIAPRKAWLVVFGYCAAVFFFALVCTVLSSHPRLTGWRRRVAQITYRPAVVFGKARILFSVLFLFSVFSFYGIQDSRTALLVVFWGLFIALWPLGVPELLSSFRIPRAHPVSDWQSC